MCNISNMHPIYIVMGRPSETKINIDEIMADQTYTLQTG